MFAAVPQIAWFMAGGVVIAFIVLAIRPPKIVVARFPKGAERLELLIASGKFFVAAGAALFLGVTLYSVKDMKWYQPLPAFLVAPILFGFGVIGLRVYFRRGPE